MESALSWHLNLQCEWPGTRPGAALRRPCLVVNNIQSESATFPAEEDLSPSTSILLQLLVGEEDIETPLMSH